MHLPHRKLIGHYYAPPSKSYTQRVLACALLHGGTTIVECIGKSNDELACLGIIQQLGTSVEWIDESSVKLISNGLPNHGRDIFINCGESGLALRMFLPILTLINSKIVVEVEGSLLKRPIHLITDFLTQVGINYELTDGHFPLAFQGGDWPKSLVIDGSMTSQLLTGILIGSSFQNKNLEIKVLNLKSSPYVDLTLEIINLFHRNNITVKDDHYLVIEKAVVQQQSINIKVEGDWSNASFFVAAAVLNGRLFIENLNPNSAQADRQILNVLTQCGVKYHWEEQTLIVEKSKIQSLEFDATDCPDLFPPLALLSCGALGNSKIRGVHRLLFKESNRMETIQSTLNSIGVDVVVKDDVMFITPKKLHIATLNTFNDHRIAMLSAMLSLLIKEGINLEGTEAVNKSYPNFFEDLNRISII